MNISANYRELCMSQFDPVQLENHFGMLHYYNLFISVYF